MLVRLGIWQLDRLEQRRAFNARVAEQVDQAMLVLDENTISLDLIEMEYRSVEVMGVYDHGEEIAVRNQAWRGLSGVNLLTPLLIPGSEKYVLVNRGWIPMEDAAPENWSQFEELGIVTVRGMIRLSEIDADYGGVPNPTLQTDQERLDLWNFINLERIGAENDLSLLLVYIHQAPDGEETIPPFRTLPELDLTEGSHAGYAVQWFTFAIILLLGYPFFVRSQTNMPQS